MTEMLGIIDVRKQDPRALLLLLEAFERRANRALEDVVRQNDGDGLLNREALGESECFRDASLALLVGVRKALDPVLVPVPEQPVELPGVSPAADEKQLPHAGSNECLHRVRHHRAVVDRQQMLVRDPRAWMKASALPP